MKDYKCPLYKCFKNGLTVKPVIEKKKMYLAYFLNDDLVHTFNKSVTPSESGKAMYKVYEYLVEKHKL